MWSGTIGLGLVNVPVELVTAARDLDYHFRELHEKDGARVRHQRFCSKENKPVEWDEIGHGYELDEGKMVVLTDSELESVAPERNRTIEIESFVDLAEVDPIFFDHPYFLVPGNNSAGTLKAYKLLVEAISKSKRVAIGRFVMRTKEYLAAVREVDGALALSTMKYEDEIRGVDMLPEVDSKPTKRAIDDAVAVIRERSVDWDPERYKDCYRLRLKKVIDSKRKGETIKAPEQVDDESLKPAPDLMAALKKTLEANRKKAASKGGGKKSAAKKSRTKKAKPNKTNSGKKKSTKKSGAKS